MRLPILINAQAETPPDLRARKMQLLSMAAQSDDEETEDDREC